MKNKLIFVVIIILLLVAGGGYYLYAHKSTPETAVKNTVKQAQTSVFSSIKDALSKSLSLECKFTDDTGKSTTAYIKAGAVRADVVGKTPEEQYNNSSVIVKDNTLSVWDTVKKQGMTMQFKPQELAGMVPASTGANKEGSTTPSVEKLGDVMAILEKYKDSCKPAVVADSLFTVPADVTLQDLSKMMQPTGMPIVSGRPSQEDIQKMMQQYQNQTPAQ